MAMACARAAFENRQPVAALARQLAAFSKPFSTTFAALSAGPLYTERAQVVAGTKDAPKTDGEADDGTCICNKHGCLSGAFVSSGLEPASLFLGWHRLQ